MSDSANQTDTSGDFWNRVLDLCKRRGISRKALAQHIGWKPAQISMGVKRGSIPVAMTVMDIGALLDTTAEYLLTGKYRDLPLSNDPEYFAAAEDCAYSKTTREIVMLLPELSQSDAELLLGMVERMSGKLDNS